LPLPASKPRLVELPPRDATEDDLGRVHTPGYVEALSRTAARQGYLDPDTYFAPLSFAAASRAAGGCVAMVDALIDGAAEYGLALVRPPGHHALKDRAMGFCIFNNLAIGARYALKEHGLERILIVDWDLHHGNGIQDIFYDDPHVLYVSLHRYPCFPWTGGAEETGEGAGRGFNVNIPLEHGCSDPDYANLFRHLLLPITRHFRPQIILVAAGFDIHHSDPLRSMSVTEPGFARMTQLLMEIASELCGKRLVLALEGGYNSEALRNSVAMVLWELTGRSVINREEMRLVEDAQYGTIEKTIEQVKKIQAPFWGDL